MSPDLGSHSASRRAQRALARAAGDRRILAGAAATVGAAVAAGVARELVAGRDGGDDEATESHAYRIKRGETAAEAVGRIAGGRLDEALVHLSDGLDENVAAAIHETRKDLKKTRAVLRLVRERIGEETYRRDNARLRDAGRTLAGSRDAEAKVETLDALFERFSDELPRPFAELRKRLEEERDSMVAAQRDQDSEIRRRAAEAVEEITAVRASVDDWRYTKSGWKLLSSGLKRSYRRGRIRFSDVRQAPTYENVHEWRKRVKDLWYHLRLLRDSWPTVLGDLSDEAHSLSDLLGDHHDLSVLNKDIHGRPDLAGGKDAAAVILSVIETRQEELIEAAIPLGERLYADSPKDFARRLRAYWRAWRPD